MPGGKGDGMTDRDTRWSVTLGVLAILWLLGALPAGALTATSTATHTATPTPTPCETFPPPHLSIGFSVQPPHPKVGDAVRLSFGVSGRGGLPGYTLAGTQPYFDGDTSVVTASQLIGVSYDLTAVQAGTATLTLSVYYETIAGCVDQPVYYFTSQTSPAFTVDVAEADTTITPTPTATATATSTPPASTCVGDCDGTGAVTIDELTRGVNIALGDVSLEQCPSFDRNGDGDVTIDELLAAVGYALAQCP